ncbi:MAG: DUF2726 domain-containing protein [Clostridium lundense]|nr:DUF2726 domain-containing protein [Clostridium lundense]
MDINTELVLIKGSKTKEYEDKTDEIADLHYASDQVAVTYLHSNKTYNYNSSNVLVLKNPKTINLNDKILIMDGFPIKNSGTVLDFGEYIKVINDSGRAEAYHKSRISYEGSCLTQKQPKAIFEYLKNLCPYISVMDNGRSILFEQYEKLTKISNKSVLSTYLSGSEIKKNKNKDIPIFPFGFNLSQKKAVITSLENSISIIEGPPGTGKTQTILNIIANVVAKGKTIGIVSSNNSATSNVQEKLEKNGYGFITALLGNAENKTNFFEHKQTDVPDIKDWGIEKEEGKILYEELSRISNKLDELIEKQNKIAKLKEELSKLRIEQSYYEANFKDVYISVSKFSVYRRWSSNSMLDFIAYLESSEEAYRESKLNIKVYLLLKYGIWKFKFFNENNMDIIFSLKRDYYKISIEEKEHQIQDLELKLQSKSYKELMETYVDLSVKLFNNALYRKYSKKHRKSFTAKSYKSNFKNFLFEYPVILSTTHSIISSISENYLFDYIVIDEASQVDLVTASLALACCKNVVIVGDVKQLPQIVDSQIEKISNEMFYSDNIAEFYNYSKYSIISSLMKIYKDDLPKTLLSEHYRCNPKIIGFCNEKFYNNELIIMTKENSEEKPLKIYKTAPGNHARKDKFDKEKGWYNIRQIEVIRDEIINENKAAYGEGSEVGIICPYRKQVTETNRFIGKSAIEVDTVHKFQGREKNTIIFTTVVNDINSFVDDPNLINVAVSRAVKELIVVTSNKLFKQHGTNIGDLIRYIEYNSLEEAIIKSQKVSVFDLLYSEYSDKLLKVMNSSKHVSNYKSENLMYGVIEEVLNYQEFSSFKCVLHVPLKSIVRDCSNLNSEERNFVQNPWTHVDFLIFNKLDKEPVLAIEVDGHEYHRNNEKQLLRDAMKDKILEQINLPLLRISTNESGEREKLIEMLNKVVRLSGEVVEGE